MRGVCGAGRSAAGDVTCNGCERCLPNQITHPKLLASLRPDKRVAVARLHATESGGERHHGHPKSNAVHPQRELCGHGLVKFVK